MRPEVIPLRRLSRFAYGEALATEVRGDGHVPVMSSGGLTGSHDRANTQSPVIVIGRKGSHGSVHWSDKPAFVIDTAYYVDRTQTTHDLRWLYYVLVSANLARLSQDVGVPGLSRERAYEAEVPYIRDLSEQRRIADFLDDQVSRIDQAAAIHQAQHELLVVRHARSIDLAIDAAADRSVRFKFLLKRSLQYGANEPSSFDDPRWPRYIRITDITSEGKLRSDTFRSLPPETAAPYRLSAGDLLFARSGATVGKCFLFNESSTRAAFAGYLIRAQVARHLVMPEFVRYFSESAGYWSQIRQGEIQATIQNMSAERYANILVPLPSMEEQLRVVKMLSEQAGLNHRVRSEIGTQLGLLQERKWAVITAAVTGGFDVTTASGRGVA